MRINKNGSVGIILIAVYMLFFINVFYVIFINHFLSLEKKNISDYAINNATNMDINIMKNDFNSWKSVFEDILEDNSVNSKFNFIYLIEKDDESFNIYDVNGKTLILIRRDLNDLDVKEMIRCYTQNENSLSQVIEFIENDDTIHCLILNKQIGNSKNKDYVIKKY